MVYKQQQNKKGKTNTEIPGAPYPTDNFLEFIQHAI